MTEAICSGLRWGFLRHAAAAKLAAAGVAVRKARARVVRAKAAWKSAENALLLLEGARQEALAEFQRIVGAEAEDE